MSLGPAVRSFVVGPGQAGARLDLVLLGWLGGPGATMSRKAVQRLIVAGAVTVDGRVRTHPSAPLAPGQRVRVAVARDEATPRSGRLDLLGESAVRFEDEWLIVVDKPAGVPTHATIDPSRPHLHGLVTALLAAREPAAAEAPYLAIHHRLDRDTTGLVLFAKDRRANRALAEAFAGRAVRKQYLALCQGHVEQRRWVVRNHLGRVSPPRHAARYGAVSSGGEWAETEFRVRRGAAAPHTLVEARPRTGRTHQIRVHLAEGGNPIAGDTLYGGVPGPRVLLHAWRLTLPHPRDGSVLSVESPPPAELRAAGD